MNTVNSIELLLRYLYQTHEIFKDVTYGGYADNRVALQHGGEGDELLLYNSIVALLLPKKEKQHVQQMKQRKNVISNNPSTAAFCYGMCSRILAMDIIVNLIQHNSELLMYITTILKMSSNELRSKHVRPIEINNVSNTNIYITIKIIMTRVIINIVHLITTRRIKPLRLSGRLRWDGASITAQLYNSIVLIGSHCNDIILGNSWMVRSNFGDEIDNVLDPLNELILATLQLWGLLVAQFDNGNGGSEEEGKRTSVVRNVAVIIVKT